MSFVKRIPGIRRATTNRHDTLQKIALRELGDASKWVDIALLNNLKPPYIVQNQADLTEFTLLAGSIIDIPAPKSYVSVTTDADGVFLKDVLLNKGLIDFSGGDIEKVSGLNNLKQALLIRISTIKQELMFHPEYGCYVYQLLGKGATATAMALAAFYVKSALLEENRVDRVISVVAEVIGDAIRVDAVVQPITGKTIDINALIK